MSYDRRIEEWLATARPAGRRTFSPRARRIRLPWRGQDIGLGELAKRITSILGVTPCDACQRRAAALDGMLVFVPRARSETIVRSSDCTSFKGKCTGFGGTQCVTAPSAIEPDAPTITQCCSGRFQYPWVEVCPGKPATQGCGFCLF
jgi:hypothetical protein